MRPAYTLLLLWLAFSLCGCSGLTCIMLENDLDVPVRGTFQTREDGVHWSQLHAFEVPGGETRELYRDFMPIPGSILIRTQAPGVREKIWTKAQLPEPLQRKSSAGGTETIAFWGDHIEFTEFKAGIIISDFVHSPTFAVFCSLAVIHGTLWFATRRRRHYPKPYQM